MIWLAAKWVMVSQQYRIDRVSAWLDGQCAGYGLNVRNLKRANYYIHKKRVLKEGWSVGWFNPRIKGNTIFFLRPTRKSVIKKNSIPQKCVKNDYISANSGCNKNKRLEWNVRSLFKRCVAFTRIVQSCGILDVKDCLFRHHLYNKTMKGHYL